MNDMQRFEEERFVEAMVDLWVRDDAPQWIRDYVREELKKQRGLKEENETEVICKIIFDVPYYFCGSCKAMLDMYATKANFCSKCGKKIKWL